MRLSDRVCLITGGGSGIGQATATLFAREGARLSIADKREEAAKAVAAECRELGSDAIAVTVDVSDAAGVELMVDTTVRHFGRLDILIANAGYGFAGTVVDTEADAWDALMAVNVRGVYLSAKYAIPAMVAHGGGVIVNTASALSQVGVRNRAAYVASKGAVAALTRAIAIDHVDEGIRCNAVAPGTIDTPYYNEMMKKADDAAALRRGLESRQLLNRLGTPEEIADAILFLASDSSRFATGSILTVDGGWTAY